MIITTTAAAKGKINNKTRETGRGGNEEENIEKFGLELSQKIVNATEGGLFVFIHNAVISDIKFSMLRSIIGR